MAKPKQGDTVQVSYIGTLDNGRIFENTNETGPRTFTLGSGEIFPALEEAICDMEVKETRNIVIPAEQAYGPRLKENILVIPREKLPAGVEPKLGAKMNIGLSSGRELIVLITEVTEDSVTLDGNHFLAGLDLTFALRLDAIN